MDLRLGWSPAIKACDPTECFACGVSLTGSTVHCVAPLKAWLTTMSEHGGTLELNHTGLADYGQDQNLLECVPSYIHAVPSLNAANVYMLTEMATVHTLINNGTSSPIADKLTSMATKTLRAVLSLYAPGEGMVRILDTMSYVTLHRR